MKTDKTTIHDIARLLDINASTVSRALNNDPRISVVTKNAVLAKAKQLEYQPHNLAAALRNGKSRIIGVIIPTADRSFFGSIVRGIEEIAMESNYQVMICQTYDEPAKEAAAVEALMNSRVDGILASFSKKTVNFNHFLKARNKGIPVITFDRTNDRLPVSQVVIDDYRGGYKAVQHLIDEGCRHIAHFTSFQKISIYKDRLRGYRDALERNGLPFRPELVVESDMQLEDGRRSMQKLLEAGILPDGVFSSSDLGAMGALQILKENKIKVPAQVAIVGFSNEPFTLFSDPPLTSVDQHCKRMGNLASKIFLEEARTTGGGLPEPKKIILMPELIVRASSCKSTGNNPVPTIL